MKHFFKLIHWPDLLGLALAQFLIKYALFEPFKVPITLNWFGVSLLALSIIFLASTSFIMKGIDEAKINGISTTDHQIVAKRISLKRAYNLFFILNVAGVVIGFYLANIIGYPSFAILFILASALLHIQASSLKNLILIRPLIISLLIGLSIISLGLIDLFPAMNEQNKETLTTFFSILIDYGVFMVLLSFYHQLLLNQQNFEEDHKYKRNSISLILGRKRANKMVFIAGLLPVLAIVYYIFNYLYLNSVFFIFAMVFILAPLTFTLIKLLSTQTKKDYSLLANILKLTMFFTIISIALYQFILN